MLYFSVKVVFQIKKVEIHIKPELLSIHLFTLSLVSKAHFHIDHTDIKANNHHNDHQ